MSPQEATGRPMPNWDHNSPRAVRVQASKANGSPQKRQDNPRTTRDREVNKES